MNQKSNAKEPYFYIHLNLLKSILVLGLLKCLSKSRLNYLPIPVDLSRSIFLLTFLLILRPCTAFIHLPETNLTFSVHYYPNQINKDQPALFGSNVPHDGLKGQLVPASLVSPFPDACFDNLQPPLNSSLKNSQFIQTLESNASSSLPPSQDASWIALVERGNCSFVKKVENMQNLGAVAVIVGDNTPHPELVVMSGDYSQSILIPSVFVSYSTYQTLLQISLSGQSCAVLYPNNKQLPFFDLLLVIIASPVFILILVYVFWWAFSYLYKKNQKTSLRNFLHSLPNKIFSASSIHQNDPEACVICLEDFVTGDELRSLPCSHEFHASCIDPWIVDESPTCPICKKRVNIASFSLI